MSGDEGFTYTYSHPTFNRIDVETVIHSDNGFAAVSYLRVKAATLEEKSEGGEDLAVPPLLETDFARIQTLLRSDQPAGSLTHVVSEPVVRQPTVQSCGLSGLRRGGWVAIGNVLCTIGQDVTFEEEVAQCFCHMQGSSVSIEEMPF